MRCIETPLRDKHTAVIFRVNGLPAAEPFVIKSFLWHLGHPSSAVLLRGPVHSGQRLEESIGRGRLYDDVLATHKLTIPSPGQHA
jgi:hypothetical protein